MQGEVIVQFTEYIRVPENYTLFNGSQLEVKVKDREPELFEIQSFNLNIMKMQVNFTDVT